MMKEILRLSAIFLVLVVSGLFFFSCKKIEPEPEKKTYEITVFVTNESSIPM